MSDAASSSGPKFEVYSSGWIVGPVSKGNKIVVIHPYFKDQIITLQAFISANGGQTMYDISAVSSSGTGIYGWDIEIKDK